jgi:hypothetical protein
MHSGLEMTAVEDSYILLVPAEQYHEA